MYVPINGLLGEAGGLASHYFLYIREGYPGRMPNLPGNPATERGLLLVSAIAEPPSEFAYRAPSRNFNRRSVCAMLSPVARFATAVGLAVLVILPISAI